MNADSECREQNQFLVVDGSMMNKPNWRDEEIQNIDKSSLHKKKEEHVLITLLFSEII